MLFLPGGQVRVIQSAKQSYFGGNPEFCANSSKISEAVEILTLDLE